MVYKGLKVQDEKIIKSQKFNFFKIAPGARGSTQGSPGGPLDRFFFDFWTKFSRKNSQNFTKNSNLAILRNFENSGHEKSVEIVVLVKYFPTSI